LQQTPGPAGAGPNTPRERRRRYALGIFFGVLMSAIAAVYTATARYGVLHGLTPYDLTAMRFGVAALLLGPVFAGMGFARLGDLGWRRALILTACAGPAFSLLLFTGLRFAPLAHGAVITPATIALTGLVLAAILFRDHPDRNRWLGILMILGGLAALGGDGLLHGSGWQLLAGDLMFIGAGVIWAVFGTLLRHWRVNTMRASAAVAVLSAFAFIPCYLAFADLGGWQRVGAGHIALQLLIQGAFAGVANLVLFVKTVEILGPALAGLFGALVPALAVLTAIPILGEFPNWLQWTGLIVISIGLALSLIRPSTRLKR
jgi:drug/metabolite transporter (DMT)-like permease